MAPQEGNPSREENGSCRLPFRSRFVTVSKGLRMHAFDEGDGPVAFLLHGNPTWAFLYRELIPALRDHMRVVAPDHIGCGYSDRPDEGQYGYRLRDRVEDFSRLVDSVTAGEPVDLVVHDWGGLIGLAWAVDHPDRLRSLVVFNSAAFRVPEDRRFHWTLRWARRSPLAHLAIRRWNAFGIAAMRLGCRRRPTASVRRGFYAPHRGSRGRIAQAKFVEDIPLAPGDPSYDVVKNTELGLERLKDRPVLVCWGLRDFIFHEGFLQRWKWFFPSAEVRTFSDAGHYVLEDAGERVIPAVRDFLVRIQTSASD